MFRFFSALLLSFRPAASIFYWILFLTNMIESITWTQWTRTNWSPFWFQLYSRYWLGLHQLFTRISTKIYLVAILLFWIILLMLGNFKSGRIIASEIDRIVVLIILSRPARRLSLWRRLVDALLLLQLLTGFVVGLFCQLLWGLLDWLKLFERGIGGQLSLGLCFVLHNIWI